METIAQITEINNVAYISLFRVADSAESNPIVMEILMAKLPTLFAFIRARISEIDQNVNKSSVFLKRNRHLIFRQFLNVLKPLRAYLFQVQSFQFFFLVTHY